MPLGIPHSRFLSWDEEDQDKALAFVRAKAELCPECGTREHDWQQDPDAWRSNNRRCKGCEVLEIERGNIPEGEKGVKVYLEPGAVARARDEAEAAAEEAREA